MTSNEFFLKFPESKILFDQLLAEFEEKVLKAQRPANEIIISDAELIRQLGVCKRTTNTWRAKRMITFIKVGSLIYYKLSEVLDFMDKYEIKKLYLLLLQNRIVMAKKSCKNVECPNRTFFAKRRDQLFCSIRCRNQYYNAEYKFRMDPYKQVADQLYQQDLALTGLLNNQQLALLDFESFEPLGIKLKNARQLVYENGKLMKAIFVCFTITKSKDNYYKIERL